MQKSCAVLDSLNLIQCWMNSLLYFYDIYPKQAFVFRTLYGIATPVAAAQSLSKYIEEFIQEIEEQIESVNFIEFQLIESQKIVQVHRLSLLFLHNNLYMSRQQKEINLKHFVDLLIKNMESIQVSEVSKQFRMFVELRAESLEPALNDGQFVDSWILEGQPTQRKGQATLADLKLMDLNIFVSRGVAASHNE